MRLSIQISSSFLVKLYNVHNTLPPMTRFTQSLLNTGRRSGTHLLNYPHNCVHSEYVPAGQITLPELQPSTWASALGQFRDGSARGPDGINAADLKAMPGSYKHVLLDHFRSIEAGAPWPQQLLQGLGFAKVDGADSVDQFKFRPITVLRMPHRAWSSIRSRQALQQIEPLIAFPSCLPGKPSKSQSLVEVFATELLGHATDICKAFNCLF